MNTDLSAKATVLACSGVAQVVFLWDPGDPAAGKLGGAGLSGDADGLSPIQMVELATSLAAFARSIAHASAAHVDVDADEAWKYALHMMDAPHQETRTRSMTVPVGGGGS